jgi:hypothetical protein
MRISKVFCIVCLLYLGIMGVSAAGESVISKTLLPYEVQNVSVTSSNLTIAGWGLLIESQHFISSADHTYELEFTSPQHTFRVSAPSVNLNLTEVMRYAGIPMCALSAYFQKDTTCYYRYENVGYSATIPLTMFQTGNQYTVYLVVHAISSNFHKKIPIYYPITNDIVFMKGQKEYRIASKLNDTKLTVKYATVVARKNPDKTGAAWYSGTSCSTAYGNLLFLQLDSVYASIKERYANLTNYTTYYRVASKLSSCVDSRRRIVEGSVITPVWIPSSFVEYSGTPMIISTQIINTAPVITTVAAVVKVGETFEWNDHVTAFDAEEGNLSSQIEVISDNYHKTQIPGRYSMSFRVTDLYGASDNKTLDITVIEADNTAPTLIADDFEVLLNTKIDYLEYAGAFDKEDGDLTSKIVVSTSADLSTPGIYPVCYDVADSRGTAVRKCVKLTVFDYATLIARFRFVSREYLFYNEEIPSNWNDGYLQRLVSMLETDEVLASLRIDP